MNAAAGDERIVLSAIDGASISAYRYRPESANGAGLIVVQEIFGVTAHIRAVAADYADRGYQVLAPQLFDRLQIDVALDCDDQGMARGRDLVGRLGFDGPMRDLRAAADHLHASGCRAVGVVGYCWGGAVAFLAATRLGLPAVSYYGRLVPQFLHERPQAPLMFHFGDQDALIPPDQVEGVAAALPQAPLYRYAAGHAFNRLGDDHGEPHSANLALQRSLGFFERHLA
ncbi:MAG: dienelactone hydrolase family protein [Lysobacterales bacterium]